MTEAVPASPSVEWPTLRASNLCTAFVQTCKREQRRVAFKTRRGNDISFDEYRERVARFAAALASHGVAAGDVVALMLTNRPEFHVADVAALHLGATPVSIYNTSPVADIAWVLEETRAQLVVTECAFAERVTQAAAPEPARRPSIVLVDGERPGTIELDAFLDVAETPLDLARAADAIPAESVAALVYTSGTGAHPKGVEHTHRSLLANLASMHALAPVAPDSRFVSYLPMAHMAERFMSHYGQLAFGYEVTCCVEPGEAPSAFADVRPNRVFAVPRVYELLKSMLDARVAREPDATRRRVIVDAIETGLARVRAQQAGLPIPPDLERRHAQADRDVLAGLRARLGFDRLDWIGVAGAPASAHVLEYFHAIGVPVAEIWGMSEAIMCASNPPAATRLGTCGVACPGAELAVAEDGELRIRGPMLFRGYRNEPELTARVFDDGWFSTNDLATVDEDGYLTITGRKSDLIISSTGKNMSPARIEAAVKRSEPLIGHVVCVGDGRPYNVAVVTLDARAIATHGLDATDPRVRERVAAGIERANGDLNVDEAIRRFALLDGEWMPAGDELTPTAKVKRAAVAEKYRQEIDELYGSA